MSVQYELAVPWRELVDAQEEFIELLKAENKDMAVLASVHGWRSSRLAAGAKARERILAAKRALGVLTLVEAEPVATE